MSAGSNAQPEMPRAGKALPSARADIALGLFVAALAALLFALTFSWSASAGIFPRIVAGLLCALGLANAVQGLRRLGEEGQAQFLPQPLGFLKVWLSIPAYFAGVILIGFPLATVLVTIGLSALFGFRRWPVALLAGTVFVALILLVFTGLFDRPLPNGLLLAPWLK